MSKETEKTELYYEKLIKKVRNSNRPYSLDYINKILDNKFEIKGDRSGFDDNSIVCYFGKIESEKVLIIAQQKGRTTKCKIQRNFGMPNPEGYKKALRAAKIAEKFEIPIICLIDTPGAFPGIKAEENGQSEAIARNLLEFMNLNTIIVSIVVGEGGSGGALALGICDKLLMMENSMFSVISPEGCSSILWKDNQHTYTAAKALKVSSSDLKEFKLCDEIIKEPINGAHNDYEESIKEVKVAIIKNLEELKEK
ncbi:acetyl-CoA carboxylase carboxyltransferase subunit alpha, partial [bacterium]|nr:acetyl-CoA carboxylase carboxyltransferase subunit alpha [bacterium]